ncbi:MAG: DEAD/DEAH box helicase, partial [Planctomycetaceae bacterium]
MSSDGLFRGWQTRRNVHLAFQESRSLCCLPAGQLQQLSLDLRWDCQVRGLSNRRVTRAFALVIEAARRTQGLNFHRVQVAAGWQMLSRVVVEMQTGEGKTLSALLPVFARTLDGEGCHVMTANDYLAVRDAQFAESVLGVLGIRVGVVMQSADAMQRQQAYQCDVTYGTVQEFAFDYLRDRLREHTGAVVHGGASSVQRSLAAALVDEADSVLIDQACTPLILSAADNAAGSVTTMLQWADRRAAGLVEGTDFIVDGGGRTICLTEQGRQSILLQPAPADVSGVAVSELLNRVRQAVLAQVKFARDRDYVVTDERVQIVDESTGRILEGR